MCVCAFITGPESIFTVLLRLTRSCKVARVRDGCFIEHLCSPGGGGGVGGSGITELAACSRRVYLQKWVLPPLLA